MSSRPRAAMIEQTRARLIASARQAFARLGYAKTSMDDLTAEAGLTRGALYHHFGDKQGLLAAVVEQIDSEMDERLEAISAAASDPWQGFAQRCRAYLEMAQEAEIRRIVLQDARAVLGQRQPAEEHCIDSLSRRLQALVEAGLITPAPSQALARLITASLVDARCGSPRRAAGT
ncbi:TetR family transcriptional regulator, partial [Pseudomonas protegens]